MKQRILFVDDEPRVLDALRRMLHAQQDVWDLTFLDRPEDAWEALTHQDFDAAVLDVKMPGMSGLELLGRLQRAEPTKDLPVVMLTGLEEHGLKRRALQLGATDLLNKPVHPADLLARLHSVLRLKSCQDALKAQNALLEQKVEQRTMELLQSRADMIWRLGKIAEQRDVDPGNHVIRVGFFSRAIAEALGMKAAPAQDLFLAAPLHDIGMIGVPDRILSKQGALSQREQAVLRQHCAIGARLLQEDPKLKAAFTQWRAPALSVDAAPLANPLLEIAAAIALAHHERWDGNGYPEELCGEQIPLPARIVAVADVFDALTSARPYRPAHSEEWALELMHEESGRHFDPAVYAAFVKALPEIRLVRQQFADPLDGSQLLEDDLREEDLVCR